MFRFCFYSTVDSGLNSMVMANNNEMVLLPINEPTFGTKRKSQIQTYLEQNESAGVQHIAVKTNDIFSTLKEMRQRRFLGGFEYALSFVLFNTCIKSNQSTKLDI